jgi:succinoglycan biosynthesis protein ExoM
VTHVAIAIATYRRPEGLRRLIASLEALLPVDPAVRVTLIVIDNDAATTLTPEHYRSRYDTIYRIEPRKGLAAVRNACLDAVPESADFLAFVDDDEWVEPDWLAQLLAMQTRTNADIVQGVVRPIYSIDAPQWMRSGGYHEVGPFEDGAPLSHGASGNVLIRLPVLRRIGARFHSDFNVSGGEDVDFFHQLLAGGATMVAANHAVAWEPVPAERSRLDWIVKRRFRTGHTLGVIARRRGGRLQRFAKATGRIGMGLVQACVGIFSPRDRGVRGLTNVAWGLGTMAGLMLGRPYK